MEKKTAKNAQKTTKTTRKGPNSSLTKLPFFRVKLIEAKNIFISHGTKQEPCDAYATISYGNEQAYKTEVISKTCNPRWNKSFQFNLNESQEQSDLLVISIYDSDPLGSDGLVANQIIPINSFRTKLRRGREEKLWIRLNNLSADSDHSERYVIETTDNLIQKLEVPKLEDIELDQEDPTFLNARLPKLHLVVEMMDEQALSELKCKIIKIKQSSEEDGLHLTYYKYIIRIQRKDGLEWLIERRYSEMLNFKRELAEVFGKEVTLIPFPEKNILKFTSIFSSFRASEYQKNSLERRTALENFLNELTQIREVYSNSKFIEFFSSQSEDC